SRDGPRARRSVPAPVGAPLPSVGGARREAGVPRAAKNRGGEARLDLKPIFVGGQMRVHRFPHGTALNAHLPTLSGIRRRPKMRVWAAWANACVALPDCNAGAARLPTLRARREWVCTEWWANACTAVGLRNVGVARLTTLRSFPFARSRAFD